MSFYTLLFTVLISVLLHCFLILFISKPETALLLEYLFLSLKLMLRMPLLLKLLNISSFLTLFFFCGFCGPLFSSLTTYVCTKAKIINLINKDNSKKIVPLLPLIECIYIRFFVSIRNGLLKQISFSPYCALICVIEQPYSA